MRSRQYLRGRVRGRRVAELGYYDASLDEAGRAAQLASADRRPRAGLSGAHRAVAVLTVLFAVLVCVGTIARPWRIAHLAVFAVAAAYAVLNAWWLPRRASARPRAAWVVATVAGFFGGLAVLGLASAALR